MRINQKKEERTWDISDDMKNDKIVRASELGQYEFCSMYHYLVKNGAKIEGEGKSHLDEGTAKHIRHGRNINNLRVMNRGLSYLIAIGVGVLLLIILLSFL